MKNDNGKKSVIFLSDSLVLSDNEIKSIEYCCVSEILIFVYSEKIMKQSDVSNVCNRMGSTIVDFVEIDPFDEKVMRMAEEWNETGELYIDLSFASSFHVMTLTPFGYLPGNDVIILNEGTPVKVDHIFLDYNACDEKDIEIIMALLDCPKTVDEICCIWAEKEKKSKETDSFNHIPNYRKTLYRRVKSLCERGYIDKDGERPTNYCLNANQKLMLRLARR